MTRVVDEERPLAGHRPRTRRPSGRRRSGSRQRRPQRVERPGGACRRRLGAWADSISTAVRPRMPSRRPRQRLCCRDVARRDGGQLAHGGRRPTMDQKQRLLSQGPVLRRARTRATWMRSPAPATRSTCRPGKVLAAQGPPATSSIVIVEGTVSVERDGQHLRDLGAGRLRSGSWRSLGPHPAHGDGDVHHPVPAHRPRRTASSTPCGSDHPRSRVADPARRRPARRWTLEPDRRPLDRVALRQRTQAPVSTRRRPPERRRDARRDRGRCQRVADVGVGPRLGEDQAADRAVASTNGPPLSPRSIWARSSRMSRRTAVLAVDVAAGRRVAPR